ncbi:MAG: hypothetical protein JO101_06265 [Candidatus Eremiobacteraeota bacterium]|nr:hypothetical protein [Candidatus Eremiobacteraeota bacterium]
MIARAERVVLVAAVALAVAGWPGIGASQGTPPASSSPPSSSGSAEGESDGIALLRASMSARRRNSYVGQVEMIRWGPSGASASIAKIEHLAPDRTHRIYVAPADVYGDSVVIRGAEMISFDNRHQKAVISHGPVYNTTTFMNNNFELLVANYRPILGAPDEIAGRPAIPCSLINRYTGERVMRLWIDRATKLVLQRETYHANGTLGTRLQFDHIRFTSAIQPRVFSTGIPQGFSVVQGRTSGTPSTNLEATLKAAGFTPASPHYLPEGFTIMAGDVTVVKGVKTLHLLYSDGLRSLSLFENASGAAADFGALKPIPTKVEDHEAKYVSDGPTLLLAWKESGLALALVGDLELKELQAIAASVIP